MAALRAARAQARSGSIESSATLEKVPSEGHPDGGLQVGTERYVRICSLEGDSLARLPNPPEEYDPGSPVPRTISGPTSQGPSRRPSQAPSRASIPHTQSYYSTSRASASSSCSSGARQQDTPLSPPVRDTSLWEEALRPSISSNFDGRRRKTSTVQMERSGRPSGRGSLGSMVDDIVIGHRSTLRHSKSSQCSTSPSAIAAAVGFELDDKPLTFWESVWQQLTWEKLKTHAHHACSRILRSRLFAWLMAVLTIYVLIGDSVRVIGFDASADSTFDVVTWICFCLFCLEIILHCVTMKDYLLGFWFIADVLACVSLILDLGFVREALLRADGGNPAISFKAVGGDEETHFNDNGEYARVARASRVGTRVARFLRVVRLFRVAKLVREVHGYWAEAARYRERAGSLDSQPSVGPGEPLPEAAGAVQAESRVGRKLSERTTHRVILLVLVILVVTPQITYNSAHYQEMLEKSAQYGSNVILQAWLDYELAAHGEGSHHVNEESPGTQAMKLEWEKEIIMYVLYHNRGVSCPKGIDDEHCAGVWLDSLCWMGYVRALNTPEDFHLLSEGHIMLLNHSTLSEDVSGVPNWNTRYHTGEISSATLDPLLRPWDVDCTEGDSELRGVSLVHGTPCPRKTLRLGETVWFMPEVLDWSLYRRFMEGRQFVFVFDRRKGAQWEAIESIAQTCFIAICLCTASMLLTKDVDKLVLDPIERMIKTVEQIRKDPLGAIRSLEVDNEAPKTKIMQRSGSLTTTAMVYFQHAKERRRDSKTKQRTTMETQILENAIIKLGSLLVLGFGEAGSEIIGANLDSEQVRVNALVPGETVEAVFGFCHIRNFDTTTEVLQEKTMVFVNQVAGIVHRVVDMHLGSANTNVGDAFSVCWRLSRYTKELWPKIAELAVMSFTQVVAQLSRDWKLGEYSQHPALLARLPNFRVSLGFGMHLGWSIEGAIGSEFKINVSYLSPHVNIATRLAHASDEYGTTIIVSEPLVRLCGVAFKRLFRPIDRVMLHGKATRLFTLDLNQRALPVERERAHLKRKRTEQHLSKAEERRQKTMREADLLRDGYEVYDAFIGDLCVMRMRDRFSNVFFQEFEKGYLNYEAGEWDVAAQVLQRTVSMLHFPRDAEDGPSRTLLEYMKGFDFEAPANWSGWRRLQQK